MRGRGKSPASPVPRLDRDVERRASASGPVVSYTLSPEELAKYKSAGAPRTFDGTPIKPPIIVKTREEQTDMTTAAVAAAEQPVDKPVPVQEEYLRLRADGNTHSRIESLWDMPKGGLAVWLAKWGLKGVTVERAKEMLQREVAPANVEAELPEPVKGAEDASPEEQAKGMARLLELLEEERKANLVLLDTNKRLMEDVDRLARGLESEEKESKRLADAVKGAAVIADQAGARIRELEERNAWLQGEIDRANEAVTACRERNKWQRDEIKRLREFVSQKDIVTLRLPIRPTGLPGRERAVLYTRLETMFGAIELAALDREIVMAEAFGVMQALVDYATADLRQLLPGMDTEYYVRKHFGLYNERHLQATGVQQEQEGA